MSSLQLASAFRLSSLQLLQFCCVRALLQLPSFPFNSLQIPFSSLHLLQFPSVPSAPRCWLLQLLQLPSAPFSSLQLPTAPFLCTLQLPSAFFSSLQLTSVPFSSLQLPSATFSSFSYLQPSALSDPLAPSAPSPSWYLLLQLPSAPFSHHCVGSFSSLQFPSAPFNSIQLP